MNSALLLFCFCVSSNTFLNVVPGSMSQALGGICTVIDEGFTAFHNPASTYRTEVAFALSRYLYGTNMFACSGTYRGNAIGVTYLNYGTIQGYDDMGFQTETFTPYAMNMILGRKLGPVAVHVKGFIETIHTYQPTGVCGGVSAHYQIQAVTMGLKVDNIGAVINENVDLPVIAAIGSRIALPSDIAAYVEIKGLPIECSGGFSYEYESITLFIGSHYVTPRAYSGRTFSPSSDDIQITAGLHVEIENYVIGYGFVYTAYSTAHHFTISFNP